MVHGFPKFHAVLEALVSDCFQAAALALFVSAKSSVFTAIPPPNSGADSRLSPTQ